MKTSIITIIVSALAAAAAVAIPAVTELVKDNPTLTVILGTIGTLIAALAQSPLGKK